MKKLETKLAREMDKENHDGWLTDFEFGLEMDTQYGKDGKRVAPKGRRLGLGRGGRRA